MVKQKWIYKNTNQIKIKQIPRVTTVIHPLNVPEISSTRKLSNVDKTSSGLKTAIFDPLGCMQLNDTDQCDDNINFVEKDLEFQKNDEWHSRRSAILSKFTTSEKLTMVTSSLSQIGNKVLVKSKNTPVDKIKTRLEQLNELEEDYVRHEHNLNQQEYMSRIEELNNELIAAWEKEQRVKALKIVIQCSKLLADTNVIVFYPSKFVLITNILDTFGKLVYERLLTHSDNKSSHLPKNFTPNMVSESTKETCRNWFYKIASIRELIPRLYIEMAILKSYSFLTSSEFSDALMRLTRMIRGIGHPLVALYARCYLCRIGLLVSKPNTDQKYLKENFYEFLLTYEQIFSDTIETELVQQNIEFGAYIELYMPALEYILHIISASSNVVFFNELLNKCEQLPKNGLLLNTLITLFDPSFITENHLKIIAMLQKCNTKDFPKFILVKSLGRCLTLAPVPQEHQRGIFDEIWKLVSELNDPLNYISCTEVWIDYILLNFENNEINQFLADFIQHMTKNKAYEHFYTQTQTILNKILEQTKDLESLLTMSNFLPTLDLFQKDTIRVEICKNIMTKAKSLKQKINDPILVNSLMFMCKILHDSISALTVDDERRQIGNLISYFVLSVNYDKDFEQELHFFVESRAAFANLDQVLIQLVHCVNRLSVQVHVIVNGEHTRKTAAFVRACSAYCFITIPSIESIFTRLNLYLLSGKVALFNQCLGQADACFKSALNLLSQIPVFIETDGKKISTEFETLNFLRSFLSTLLIVPDVPDEVTLNLFKSLIDVINTNENFQQFTNLKYRIYLDTLDILSVVVQDTYPYHVDKIDSNDTLYGGDDLFIDDVNQLADQICSDFLMSIKNLDDVDQNLQNCLLIELFTRVVLRGDISSNLNTFALKLWQLIVSSQRYNVKQLKKLLDYLQFKSNCDNDKDLEQLIDSMKNLTFGSNNS